MGTAVFRITEFYFDNPYHRLRRHMNDGDLWLTPTTTMWETYNIYHGLPSAMDCMSDQDKEKNSGL